MQKWLTLLLSLLCIEVDAQQAFYSKKIVLSTKDFADTITIEWERGQVLVPVEIEGRHYRFLLDTGAAQAVVYADSPISGCEPAGFIRSQDATGAIDTVQMVKLPPLSLGKQTLTGCHATIHHRPVLGRNIDGIIGFDLINSGLNAKIDVHAHQLILIDRKGFFKHEQGFETPYRMKYHVPYLNVNPVGGYMEQTLFDTGSRSLYAMSRQSFDDCSAKIGQQVDSIIEGRSLGRHAIGHFGRESLNEVIFLHLQQLRVFDYAFCDVHTLTTQGESSLGAGILNYGSVIFNPRKERVCFQPYNQQIHADVSNRQLEIAFVPERGMPCVGLVWERGEPYKLGFRQGDIILKIDESIVKDFHQFVSWNFIIGREYRFTVKDRRGFNREIRWVRLKK